MTDSLFSPGDDRFSDGLAIHAARILLPVEGPVMENAAVVVFEGRVVDAGPAHEMRAKYMGTIHDHGDSIICPGLINAHCHLELSPLRWRLSPSGSFFQWVRTLVEAREQIQPSEWQGAVDQAVDELLKGGVVAIGDVGNLPVIPEMILHNWPFRGIFFQEIIAPRQHIAPEVPDTIDGTEQFGMALSAHAPYSVAPSHIKAIKLWDSIKGIPFSIHVAESEDEVIFLRKGTGALRELLEEKGHWPLDYALPCSSPVRYLESLGVLDSDTICVHCVHTDEEDLEILAKAGAHACLCPRSNMFLGVGSPDITAMLKKGINVAIGTDSLASNDRLSIFAEMSSLASICPDASPEEIFRAATLGGARALGLEQDLGSIRRGKAADILVVRSGPIPQKDALEFMVRTWADGPPECQILRRGAGVKVRKRHRRRIAGTA